jgi:L-rhamnose-H+ transport protein
VALLAGVMSACFSLGLEAAEPLKAAAIGLGSQALFAGLPAILMVTSGGFITNAIYCFYQNYKNKTGKDYFGVPGSVLINNVLFCALAGILWYSQFFGLTLGKSYLTEGSVMMAFSWSILMSLNVTFSNVWGIILNEWKGAGQKTITVLVIGMLILIASLIIPGLMS